MSGAGGEAAGPHGAGPPGRGEAIALYVHVPFCVRRCHYCDFAVTRVAEAPVDEWLDCLEAELDGWRSRCDPGDAVRLDTIFVGGGTPSLLGARGVERLGALLGRCFRWDP
ncbi:MAG: hypothetical protein R6X22_14210, partial [Gemmatimonadota bacterium]